MKYLQILFFFITVFYAAANLYAQQDSVSSGMHYELKGITVKGKIPPIIQSRDTAIINPDAYHTPKDSYLKDLVKRVPGLEYDETNGYLTFNGKSIREINVNGKPFFSNNTRIPIENLPLKFISRLKIYKKQTDTEKALGITSGKAYYVLDLQTKKELNKTFINSAVAGGGNQRKKQLELHSDYFETGGKNISFHATSGNQYIASPYKGNTNNSLGLNLTHQFRKGLMLTGNVQYNRYKSGNESAQYQEQYLSENNIYSLNRNMSRQDSRTINAYTNLSWEIDKKTQLSLSANYGNTRQTDSSESENATIKTPLKNIDLQQPFSHFNLLPDSLKINKNLSRSSSFSHSYSYSVTANIIRRLNKKGTTISLNLQNSHNHNHSNETDKNTTTYYQLRNALGKDSLFIQNLLKQSPTSNNNTSAGLTFVQPLGKHLKLQFSYNFQSNCDKSTNRTYNTIPELFEYVDSLSGYSSGRTNSHDFGLAVNYTTPTLNIYLNADVLPGNRSLSRHLYGESVDTLAHLTDIRTSLHIEHIKNDRTLSFDYTTNTSQPDLTSLIPLTDNSDPLNVSRGNPNLKPSLSHNWLLAYNAFNDGLALTAGFNLMQNSVTRATFYNTRTGGRESYPVNINGNLSGNLSGRWWKSIGKFTLTAMSSGNYNRTVNLLSETDKLKRNITQSIFALSSFRADYRPSWGNLSLTENYTYNYTVNSLQKNGNFMHQLSSAINGFINLPFGLQLQTDFMYTLSVGDNMPAKEKHRTMWNASAVYRFLKEKRMEISLSWNDILNHARMYYRTTSSSGFYESYSPQVRSYVMLTLKYRFQIIK